MKIPRPGLFVIVLTAVGLRLFTAGPALGQADPPTLDELLNLEPAAAETVTEPSADDTAGQDKPDDLTESIEQALSASDAAGAFEQAVNEMNQVSRRIGRSFDPGVETQRIQESILRKLDQVIEAARQQQSSGGGGGSSGQPRDQDRGGDQVAGQGKPKPGQGQPQGAGQQASTGAAGVGTPQEPQMQDQAIQQLRKEWGALPPRLRDELSEGLRERFSPLYQQMTEAYYKALAEQE